VQNFYYLSVPYNALTDLVPVGKIVDGPPLVLIVNAKSRFKSLADLIAFAKEKPDKGTGPATSAVVTGDVQASFVFYPSAKGLIDGGQLRVLAVTSEQRMKSLPEVPTMEELGFKGFKHTGFVGLSAPKGTPPDVIAKLNKALNDSLQSAAVRERLEPLGMTIPAASNTAEAYGAYMAQEAARQGELAKLTGHALQK
jgi:tripartite-type tricarboxylate transporter receptor subunit TctC